MTRRQGWVLTIVLGSLTSLTAPAWASGGYSTEYADRDFLLVYRDQVRKIFRSSAQARGYMDDRADDVYARIFRLLPALRSLVATARKRGMPVAPCQITAPLVHADTLKDAKVAATFPANVGVTSPTGAGDLTLYLTFTKRPRDRDLVLLTKTLIKLLGLKKLHAEITDESRTRRQALKTAALAKLVTPRLGLYVGTTYLMAPADVPHFEAQLRPLFAGHEQRLAAKLQDRAWLKGFGGPLVKVDTWVKRRKAPSFQSVFNPHGPAVDGGKRPLLRVTLERGAAKVIAMVAMKQHRWGDVWRHLTKTLQEPLPPSAPPATGKGTTGRAPLPGPDARVAGASGPRPSHCAPTYKPPEGVTTWMLQAERLGPLTPGAKAAVVRQHLGRPRQRSKPTLEGATGDYRQSWRYPDLQVDLTSSSRRGRYSVDSITIRAPSRLRTACGIGIGSSRAEVLAAYGHVPDPDVKHGEGAVVAGSIFGGLVFNFEKGRVSEIFLGASAE